jgi:hypothetical protein
MYQCHVSSQGVSKKVDILVILSFNELIQEFRQSAHGSVEQIQLKKGEHRHDHLIMGSEIADQTLKIAHGSKKAMQKYKRFPLAFFNVLEFACLSDVINQNILP